MIERLLKLLVITANLVLTVAYAAGWMQQRLGAHFGVDAFRLHLALAGLAVMLTMFSDLSVMFYFIGTGMWIRDRSREIVATKRDAAVRLWDLYGRANKLKGKSFPFASMGLVFGLFTFVMGGARQVGAAPAWLHPLLASLLLLNEWAGLRFVFGAMKSNVQILDLASAELSNMKAAGDPTTHG